MSVYDRFVEVMLG